MCVLLKEEDEIEKPRSIAYCVAEKKLCVARDGGKTILVYMLQL